MPMVLMAPIALRCWGYPSMHNLWELGQTPRRRFCRTKKLQVKIAIFTYFESYLMMPKDLGQCYIKIFDIAKKPISAGMLVQNFKALCQK